MRRRQPAYGQRRGASMAQRTKAKSTRKSCQPDIDAGIARITQLMAETKAELEEVDCSSDRTIAVAYGSIRRLNKEHTAFEAQTPKLPGRRRRKSISERLAGEHLRAAAAGSTTARNLPRVQSRNLQLGEHLRAAAVGGPATARLFGSQPQKFKYPHQHPHPPRNIPRRQQKEGKATTALHWKSVSESWTSVDENVGVAVRSHLLGEGFDCWDDILLSCNRTAARSQEVGVTAPCVICCVQYDVCSFGCKYTICD